MQKIIRLLLYSFSIIIAIILTRDAELVSAQEEDYQNTDLWTPFLASMPGALIGVLNMALMSRLGSNINSGEGFPSFLPRLPTSGALKNGMIFLGKHNIQVSNTAKKSENLEEFLGEDDDEGEEEEEVDEEDEEEDDDEDDQEDEDGNDEEDEENDDEDEFEGDNDGDGFDQDRNKNKKIKEIHKYIYIKDEEKDIKSLIKQKFGIQNKSVLEFFKELMLKKAIEEQYPYIDDSQIYLPQTDESMIASIHTDPKTHSDSQTLIERHGLSSTDSSLLGRVDSVSTATEVTEKFPIKQNESVNDTNPSDKALDGYKGFVEQKAVKQYLNNNNNKVYKYDPNNNYTNNAEVVMDSSEGLDPRYKRSITKVNNYKNRVGNVPPLRENQRSEQLAHELSPHLIKLLISENNKRKANYNRSAMKSKKKKKIVKKAKSNESDIDFEMASTSKSSTKRLPKSSKLRNKDKFQSVPQQIPKRMVYRMPEWRAPTTTTTIPPPIRYMPLNEYKNILNYRTDRTDRKSDKRRDNKRNRFKNNGNEEEDDLNEDDEDDSDYPDDMDEYEDDFGDGADVESHSTVQVIQKPNEKFNVGLGGWMKRMFGFGRGRRLFGRRNHNFEE